MDLRIGLTKVGLTNKQTDVYLAALQLGAASVFQISRHANQKRPTTYLILEQLETMSLVSRLKQESKVLYKAETPERLLDGLRAKEHVAVELLPSLQAIYNADEAKPTVKMNEGTSGVRQVYTEIFTYLAHHKDEELLIFGSLHDALEHFEAQILDFFYASIGRTAIRVREIGNDDYETRKYYRASTKLNPNHDIRLIRSEGAFTETDNLLWGNSLAIFSVKEYPFVTTITSASIAETYRTLFNMAWRSGKPI